MSTAGVVQQVGKVGIATVQLMCLVHLVNAHMFEVRSVRDYYV